MREEGSMQSDEFINEIELIVLKYLNQKPTIEIISTIMGVGLQLLADGLGAIKSPAHKAKILQDTIEQLTKEASNEH